MEEAELWVDVRSWEGLYQVSSLGRIRSTPGRVAEYERLGQLWRRPVPSRILAQYVDPDGYQRVKFSGYGAIRRPKVHVLVCEAFHGARPCGAHAAHANDLKADCRSDNLRWATPSENCEDSRQNGTMPVGARNGCAKLTEDEVETIRRSPEGLKVLAMAFGISKQHVWRIKTGKRWAHSSS
jgi:hypothetical protein